jgi:hypothetical protein
MLPHTREHYALHIVSLIIVHLREGIEGIQMVLEQCHTYLYRKKREGERESYR